jgi:hypothetical protein
LLRSPLAPAACANATKSPSLAAANFLNISLETLNIDVLRVLVSNPYVKKIAIP